jgi:hypothetical protein
MGLLLAACSSESTSSLKGESGVQLMDKTRQDKFLAIMPQVGDSKLASILESEETIWYDKHSIKPGYQDSFGSPKGMRPNTIRKNLINGAVPGGHEKIFKTKGHFHFPFGTGGVDDSNNAVNINFWSVPKVAGKSLPVVYWVTNWDRWQWLFPVGTVLGEVLYLTMPDESWRAFEIRTRTRTVDGWSSDVFRPFQNAKDFAAAIKKKRPQWKSTDQLKNVVDHLLDNTNLVAKSLDAPQFPGTFPKLDGHLDTIPDIGDIKLVKDLLIQTPFQSVKGKEWKRSGDQVTFAPNTKSGFGITANNYDGGLFEVSDKFCNSCHQDAGRSFQDFHPKIAAYGELWGEDDTFSWHLFENDRFVKPDGSVRCFNSDPGAGCSVDDNRALRKEFKDSGLVEKYDPAVHPNDTYKRIPRTWTYKPF